MPVRSTPIRIPYARISLVYFAYFAVVGALTPYWSLYLDYLEFSPSAIGFIVAIPMLTKMLAPNLWGWLADKTGKRLLVARLGAAGSCICFVGILFSQQTLWFLLCIASFSFFWNAVHAQFEVVTLNYLHEKPETYSHVRLWGSVGFIVVVIGLGLAFDFISIAWLPGFIFVFLAGIFISAMSLPFQQQKPTDKTFVNFVTILKQRRVALFFLVLFLIQLSLGIYHAFFSMYMQGLGYSKTSIGFLWAVGATAEVILFLKVPGLLKRFSLSGLIRITLVLTLLRWTLTCFLPQYLPVIIFSQCLHAFTFGMTHVVAIEFVRREFGVANQSQGQAFYNAVGFGAANALGSMLGGFFFEINGQLAFVASIFIVLSSLSLHLWATKPRLSAK